MSAEVLARMAENQPIREIRVSLGPEGQFKYDFC
jgi:hypothetical protein